MYSGMVALLVGAVAQVPPGLVVMVPRRGRVAYFPVARGETERVFDVAHVVGRGGGPVSFRGKVEDGVTANGLTGLREVPRWSGCVTHGPRRVGDDAARVVHLVGSFAAGYLM